MIDHPDIKTPTEVLEEIRSLLTAIAREATRRGAEEIVDLAGRADRLASELLRQETM